MLFTITVGMLICVLEEHKSLVLDFCIAQGMERPIESQRKLVGGRGSHIIVVIVKMRVERAGTPSPGRVVAEKFRRI